MMSAAVVGGKRKHSATNRVVSKKQRLDSPSSSAEEQHGASQSASSEQLFETAAIVTHCKRRNYLIRWKGRDCDGNPFEDTWEPRRYITRATLDEWRDWRRAHRGSKRRPESDFELLPAPRGWHLKTSPTSSQYLSQPESQPLTDLSQDREEFSSQESAEPPRQPRTLVVASSVPSTESALSQPEAFQALSTQEKAAVENIPKAFVLINAHAPVRSHVTTSRIIRDSQTQVVESLDSDTTNSEGLSPTRSSTDITEDSEEDSQATYAPDTTSSGASGPLTQQETLSRSSNLVESVSQVNTLSEKSSRSTQKSHSSIDKSSPFVAGQVVLDSTAGHFTNYPSSHPRNLHLAFSAINSAPDSQDKQSPILDSPGLNHLSGTLNSLPHSQTKTPAEALKLDASSRPLFLANSSMSTRAAGRSSSARQHANNKSPYNSQISSQGYPAHPLSQNVNSANLSSSTDGARLQPLVDTTASATQGSESYHQPFLLPIEMAGEQRPPYVSTIARSAQLMQEYLQEPALKDKSQLQKLSDIFNTLRKIEDHADLISEVRDFDNELGSETQASIAQSELEQWHRHASSKFVLLEAIIQQLRDTNKTLAIFCRRDYFASTIETYLASEGIDWMRLSDPAKNLSATKFSVLLIDTAADDASRKLDTVDVAVDFAPRELEEVQASRRLVMSRLGSNGGLFVIPVPVFSISHITFLPGNEALSFSELIKLTLKNLDQRPESPGQWRRFCGVLPRGIPDARTSGALIGRVVRDGEALSDLVALHDMALPTILHPPQVAGRASTPAGQKRSREQQPLSRSSSPVDEPLKKQRVSNMTSSLRPATVADESTAQDISITHVTDSPSASHRRRGIFVDDETATQLERERANHAAQEEAMGALQSRYEALAIEKRAVDLLLKAALDANAVNEARHLKLQANLDLAKGEKAAMQVEVQETRRILAESMIGDLAELAQLREKAQKVEGLEKKIGRQDGDLEYIRKQYQAAGDSAVELARTNEALLEQNAQLQKRASEQSVKLREMFEGNSVQTAHDEVKKKAQLVQRQDQLIEMLQERLQRQDKQLKGLEEREEHRNGMALATRAGSRASSVGPSQNRGLAPEHALRAALEGARSSARPGSRVASRQSSPLHATAPKTHANAPHQPSQLRNEP